MWSSYFYKLNSNLTSPNFRLPRWMNLGQDETLTDSVPLPVLASPLTDTPIYSLTPFVSGTPATTVVLNTILEAFINEKQQLQNTVLSVALDGLGYFDLSQPSYLWVLYFTDTVSSLLVETASGYVSVQQSTDLLSLFNDADWRWYQNGSTVVLFGFDLVEQTAISDSNYWQFMDHINWWDGYSTVFVEHPQSRNWFPVTSASIRSDGFTGWNSKIPIRIRTRNYNKAAANSTLNLLVNNNQATATLIDIWNGVDEKAQWFDLSRRVNESNSSLANYTALASWFQDSNEQGLSSYVSASLRTGSVVTISSSSTSYQLPANTNYQFKNISQSVTVQEILSPDPGSTDLFLSQYVDPTLGVVSVGNQIINYSVSGGLIDIDTHIYNRTDLPLATWLINYWTETPNSSGVLLEFQNVPNVPDFLVYLNTDVQVNAPSIDTMISSFEQTSPIWDWRNQFSKIELFDSKYITGVTVFNT